MLREKRNLNKPHGGTVRVTETEGPRQGDVPCVRLRNLPEGYVLQGEVTEAVVRLGEATGHHHVVLSERPFRLWGKPGVSVQECPAVLEVLDYTQVELDHVATGTATETHAPVTLELDPGLYMFPVQRELDWTTGLFQRTAD